MTPLSSPHCTVRHGAAYQTTAGMSADDPKRTLASSAIAPGVTEKEPKANIELAACLQPLRD
jgi:hypothetical protein